MLIVVDGAVDLPEELGHSPLLRRVPGEVWSGSTPFAGTIEEFWDQLRSGNYPSTTPPTVASLESAYTSSDEVLAVHVSSQLSATFDHAREAAGRAAVHVEVVDSRSISVGTGLVASVAVQRLGDDWDPASVASLVRSLPDRLHTFAVVQHAEALRRSDRASLVPTAHLTRNHPIVLTIRGRVALLDQPRRRSVALDVLADHARQSANEQIVAWAIGHGDADDVSSVVDHLTERLGRPPSFVVRLDPTVGAHLGPDALVVGALARPVQRGYER